MFFRCYELNGLNWEREQGTNCILTEDEEDIDSEEQLLNYYMVYENKKTSKYNNLNIVYIFTLHMENTLSNDKGRLEILVSLNL